MRRSPRVVLGLLAFAASFQAQAASFAQDAEAAADEREKGETIEKKEPSTALEFRAKLITGEELDLRKLAGKVMMVVNVASR